MKKSTKTSIANLNAFAINNNELAVLNGGGNGTSKTREKKKDTGDSSSGAIPTV